MFHNANSVAKVTDFSFKKSFYIGLLREIGRLVNVNVYITESPIYLLSNEIRKQHYSSLFFIPKLLKYILLYINWFKSVYILTLPHF